jgi:3-hydroxybutyryl-CoA dehydrogenase
VRDISEEAIDATREAMFNGAGHQASVELGKLKFDEAVAAMDRVKLTRQLDEMHSCDIVIEAVPEKLELKQAVFAELDAAVKPEAIFASNTSGFVIEEVARDVLESRKPLFVGMHYSNPVHGEMCEVIYTRRPARRRSTPRARRLDGQGGLHGEGRAGHLRLPAQPHLRRRSPGSGRHR